MREPRQHFSLLAISPWVYLFTTFEQQMNALFGFLCLPSPKEI
jgi:hypothetical protein